MGVGDLANCPRCGKLFVKNVRNICSDCVKEIEDEYLRCADYLRKHKLVNIYELSQATEVAVSQITKFIREGRISIADLPNLGYPCESCGSIIQEGKLCKKCSERLNKDIKHVLSEDLSEHSDKKALGYYQMGERLKKDK